MLDLALSFLRLSAAEKLRTAGRRMGLMLFYPGMAGSAAVVVLGCLVAALWFILLPVIGIIWASLAIATAFALVSAGFLLSLGARSRRPSLPGDGPLSGGLPADLAAVLCDHKTALLLAAALAGIAAGASHGRPEH